MFEHFWLFCGLWIGGLSFVFGKFRAKPLIASGEYTRLEVNRYLKAFALAIIIPCMVFWVLQQSIQQSVEVGFHTWPEPQYSIAILLLIGLWSLLLIWTLFLDGAYWLCRCLRLIGGFPEFMLTPTWMKVLIIIVILNSVFAMFIGNV